MNFMVDFSALVGFLVMISTGFVMYLVLPHGSGKSMVWGITRHQWGDIHFWVSLVFLGLIAVHTVLHWSWIKGMVRTRIVDKMGTKGKILITLIIVFLLVMTLAPLVSPVVTGG